MTEFIPAQGLPLSSKAYSNTIGSSSHSGQNLKYKFISILVIKNKNDFSVKEAVSPFFL